jgi:hypothetical protein
MERRRKFRPTAPDALEARLVMSHGPSRAASVLLSGVTGSGVIQRGQAQASITALVNTAYASFEADYTQARSLYLASIQGPQAAGSVQAFQVYTTQRVNVLAQQLTSSLLESPQATVRVKGQANTLSALISRRVSNVNVSTSLMKALMSSIPAMGLSPASQTLYSLSEDNAIEASQIAVINGVNIMKFQDFGNKAKH